MLREREGEKGGEREAELCVEAVRMGRLIALFDTFKLYFNFELPWQWVRKRKQDE